MPLEFVLTKHKRQKLSFEGHLYYRERHNKTSTHWKCDNYYRTKCLGRVTTIGDRVLRGSAKHNCEFSPILPKLEEETTSIVNSICEITKNTKNKNSSKSKKSKTASDDVFNGEVENCDDDNDQLSASMNDDEYDCSIMEPVTNLQEIDDEEDVDDEEDEYEDDDDDQDQNMMGNDNRSFDKISTNYNKILKSSPSSQTSMMTMKTNSFVDLKLPKLDKRSIDQLSSSKHFSSSSSSNHRSQLPPIQLSSVMEFDQSFDRSQMLQIPEFQSLLCENQKLSAISRFLIDLVLFDHSHSHDQNSRGPLSTSTNQEDLFKLKSMINDFNRSNTRPSSRLPDLNDIEPFLMQPHPPPPPPPPSTQQSFIDNQQPIIKKPSMFQLEQSLVFTDNPDIVFVPYQAPKEISRQIVMSSVLSNSSNSSSNPNHRSSLDASTESRMSSPKAPTTTSSPFLFNRPKSSPILLKNVLESSKSKKNGSMLYFENNNNNNNNNKSNVYSSNRTLISHLKPSTPLSKGASNSSKFSSPPNRNSINETVHLQKV